VVIRQSDSAVSEAGAAAVSSALVRRQCRGRREGGGGRGLLVAGTEPPDAVELWDWTFAPADRHASDAHSTGTKELTTH
jgi:hypothetical protein